MTLDQTFYFLGVGAVLAPTILVVLTGLALLFGRAQDERGTAWLTQITVVSGLTMSVAILGLMLWSDRRYVPIELGDWVVIPREHFHFHLKFMFDRLSVPFAILSFVLVGTIGAFAHRYLHREPGYHRFFFLYALFLLGIVVAALAGTIETLFLGWELVGLSSALLVAYFHERPSPVLNGQWVWSVYRVADAAFLIAAVLLHHLTGEGNFSAMMGTGPWPEGQAAISSHEALGVGLLLLIAAAGKSALIPFSGWLPRAMEGPTASSAVFYGALSVHLGVYLLLRVSPILDLSLWLSGAVLALGLATALFAAITARVQTDIKTSLAYASLTQVGLITAEIGLGLRYIPLVHIIGHACLRTLQLVRAPSLLRDHRNLENAIGRRLPVGGEGTWLKDRWLRRAYRLGFERGNFDALITTYLARPFLKIFQRCDQLERRWTDFLSGGASRESDFVPAATPPGGESP